MTEGFDTSSMSYIRQNLKGGTNTCGLGIEAIPNPTSKKLNWRVWQAQCNQGVTCKKGVRNLRNKCQTSDELDGLSQLQASLYVFAYRKEGI